MYREQTLNNFYTVKEASASMSRIERHAMNVDRAATKALPRLHCHTVKLEELYDKPIPMKKKAALENFYMVKEASNDSFVSKAKAGYTAARDYSPEEIKQLGTRGYIVRQPKGPTNKNRPNERIITYKGKKYAYDHREFTHGTAKRVGAILGVLGAGATALGPAGPSRALGVGALAGGVGYAIGRKVTSDVGEEGVKGLLSAPKSPGNAYDLKRIKMRRLD